MTATTWSTSPSASVDKAVPSLKLRASCSTPWQYSVGDKPSGKAALPICSLPKLRDAVRGQFWSRKVRRLLTNRSLSAADRVVRHGEASSLAAAASAAAATAGAASAAAAAAGAAPAAAATAGAAPAAAAAAGAAPAAAPAPAAAAAGSMRWAGSRSLLRAAMRSSATMLIQCIHAKYRSGTWPCASVEYAFLTKSANLSRSWLSDADSVSARAKHPPASERAVSAKSTS